MFGTKEVKETEIDAQLTDDACADVEHLIEIITRAREKGEELKEQLTQKRDHYNTLIERVSKSIEFCEKLAST